MNNDQLDPRLEHEVDDYVLHRESIPGCRLHLCEAGRLRSNTQLRLKAHVAVVAHTCMIMRQTGNR